MRPATWISAAALCALFACHGNRVEVTGTETFDLPAGDHDRIEVLVGDGHIEVRPGGTGAIEVIVTKRARAFDRDQAQALVDQIRVRLVDVGRTATIDARPGSSGLASVTGRGRTDIELLVPSEAPALDLRTLDGRITIRDITGTISAETDDGRIRLNGVSGQARIRTRDGSIRAVDAAGDYDVSTGDGRIELDGRFGKLRAVTADGRISIRCESPSEPTADWMIRTLDGAISITLPADMAARVEATANDGRVRHSLTGFNGEVHDRRLTGAIGAASADAPLILMTTMEGRIQLNES